MNLSPREYCDMLTESHRRAKTPFSEEQITSWIEELQAVFPDLPEKICLMYIELHTKKRKKRKKRKKKSNIKQREFITIRGNEPEPEVDLTEEEQKVKVFVEDWLEYWDYEKHLIIHPLTIAVKIDMEFEFGMEKSFTILEKLAKECRIFDKVQNHG